MAKPERKLVTFAGPSLPARLRPLVDRRGWLRPPARRGDVASAVADGASTILLIDGQMIYGYPPTPQEIIEATRDGVLVFGAASLGALRAVELRKLGMIGIGWVYSQFLRGVTERDDELVVAYDEDFNSLTVAAINVRYELFWARKRDLISDQEAQAAIQAVSEVYVEYRSHREVQSCLESNINPSAAKHVLRRLSLGGIKQLDTLLALRYMRECFRWD